MFRACYFIIHDLSKNAALDVHFFLGGAFQFFGLVVLGAAFSVVCAPGIGGRGMGWMPIWLGLVVVCRVS